LVSPKPAGLTQLPCDINVVMLEQKPAGFHRESPIMADGSVV